MTKISETLNIKFPLKLKPRDQQIDGFNFLRNSINNGKKYCLLNLPTGGGKSYLAIMFINWYLNYVNISAKFDILTNSKILQEQYLKENKFIKDYRGRANYYCDPHDTDCSKGHEICKTLGPTCTDCPYEIAKKSWQASTIGLTNFHLFDTVALYVKTILQDRDSNVLIIDEAHDFESIFNSYISTDLSAKSLKYYGFDLKEIEDFDDKIRRINNIGQYIGFIQNQFLGNIVDKINWLEHLKKDATPKMKQEYSKFLIHCESQRFKFEYLIKEFGKTPDNWILDITKSKSDKMYSGILLEAKPIWCGEYMKQEIFDRYDHVIFMSGSILDRELFSELNGLEKDLSTYFDVPSTFPVNRRPIIYLKIGKMTLSDKESTFKKQLTYFKKILAKHKNEKGIIHCGTYEFSEWLQEKLIDKRLIFHNVDNREQMLQKHITADYPSIMVSPSMISGVDFYDDLSRFQIIMKIMYPYLGSNVIKARQKSKPEWYNWRTCVDTLQSYGRSIRSAEDYATTYIIDESFSNLLKYNSKYLPRWFTAAIKQLKL